MPTTRAQAQNYLFVLGIGLRALEQGLHNRNVTSSTKGLYEQNATDLTTLSSDVFASV
jgi:hypothetical protein